MDSSSQEKTIAVVGATGHTGRFVIDELTRRGYRAILIARDERKLAAIGALYRESETRAAAVEDAASLDAALTGAASVINCAGPFLDTALPVVEAAFRAKISYLDVTAEQGAVQSLRLRDAQARRIGVTVLPAAAFFGGLADLLATAVIEDETTVDEIRIAVALDRWHPSNGTRITGARNTARRLIVRQGELRVLEDTPTRSWKFPEPFGTQDVEMVPLSEMLTLAHHIKATTIESWINRTALLDVSDPASPTPEPTDDRGRSSQQFVMTAVVRAGTWQRHTSVFGRDIYAVSAPIIVEALGRLLAGDKAQMAGVRSLGEIFDADAFLETLARRGDLRIEVSERPS